MTDTEKQEILQLIAGQSTEASALPAVTALDAVSSITGIMPDGSFAAVPATLVSDAAISLLRQRWAAAATRIGSDSISYTSSGQTFGFSFTGTAAEAMEAQKYALSDLTAAEALAMLDAMQPGILTYGNYEGLRANIPPAGYLRGSGNKIAVLDANVCPYDTTMTIAVMAPPELDVELSETISLHCFALKALVGKLAGTGGKNAVKFHATDTCPIEYLTAYIYGDMDLSMCPNLTQWSLRWMIDNSRNGTDAVLLTVHPSVYNAMPTATVTAASARNISIAKATA